MIVVIGEFVAVEDDDVVVEMEVHEVRVVREVETLGDRVEPVDKVVRDVRRFDVMVEKVVAVEVQTIATVVDDEVVDDEPDYIETVVIDETVDIID